jgi:predicted transcriptional regulator of viral defense system
VFVQTRKRKHRARVTVLGDRYEFIVITGRKFFGVAQEWSDGAGFRITDREKTVLDALDRPDLCGGLPVVISVRRMSPRHREPLSPSSKRVSTKPGQLQLG